MTEILPLIFILSGLLLIAISVLYKSNNSKLKQTGIHVEGIIFDQEKSNDFNQSFDNSSSLQDDIITVRFVTKKQEWITGQIKQDFRLSYSGQYTIGETVEVYYDEANPSNFYVDSKQSDLYGRLFLGGIGLGAIGFGVFKLLV